MCKNCWVSAGSPKIVSEKTKRVADLINELYNHSLVGCYAHVVTDDWNLEDGSIDFCLESARKNEYSEHYNEAAKSVSIACLEAMKTLTMAERYSAMAIHEGYI